MARKPYTEDQSIHSMTTRQLRQYIADYADRAEERIKTTDVSTASRAFKDYVSEITYANGKIKRSTSNMNKEEMRKYAYTLRSFDVFDRESKFAQSLEYKEMRKGYETFVKNITRTKAEVLEDGTVLEATTASQEVIDYWSKFLTPKNNVSQKGFQAYKNYLNFIKSLKEHKEEYGYETLRQYAVENNNDPKRLEVVTNILNEVFTEAERLSNDPNNRTVITKEKLNDMFTAKLNAYDEQHKPTTKNTKTAKPKTTKTTKPKTLKSAKPKKSKSKSKSSQNIKPKTGRKMKTNATVREQLT